MKLTRKEISMISLSVQKVAKRLEKMGIGEYDDNYQDILLFVVIQTKKFTPTPDFPTKPFLMSAVHFGYIQKKDKYFRKERVKMYYIDDFESSYCSGTHAEIEEDVNINRIQLSQFKSKLTDTQKTIFECKAAGFSYEYMAHLLQLSTSTISRRFMKIREISSQIYA